MADETSVALDEVNEALADLQAGQSVIGDAVERETGAVAAIAAGVVEANAELHRIADKLAAGSVGPTEIREIAAKIKAVAVAQGAKAEALNASVEALASSAASLKAVVDEPDPLAGPPAEPTA